MLYNHTLRIAGRPGSIENISIVFSADLFVHKLLRVIVDAVQSYGILKLFQVSDTFQQQRFFTMASCMIYLIRLTGSSISMGIYTAPSLSVPSMERIIERLLSPQ